MPSFLNVITQPVAPQENKSKSFLNSLPNFSFNTSIGSKIDELNSDWENPQLNNDPRFTLNPDLYETTFQSEFTDAWNSFKQGIDQTQSSSAFGRQDSYFKILEDNKDKKKTLQLDLSTGKIDSLEFQSAMQQINTEDEEASKQVDYYQQVIDGNQKEMDNEPVSKMYKVKEAITQAKGGDASLWDSIKYTLPQTAGSSASLMGQTLAVTYGADFFKKLITRVAATTELTPVAQTVVAVGSLLAATGSILYNARAQETYAEIGGQLEQAHQQLLAKWQEEHPNEQPTEDVISEIRKQSRIGVDTLWNEQMMLGVVDGVEALLLPGSQLFKALKFETSFSKGISKTLGYNRLTRTGTTVGKTYLGVVGEKYEEGLQYISEKRQLDEVMGVGNYTDQNFMTNFLGDSHDTLASISIPLTNIRPFSGDYAQDKQFQFAEKSGELLGLIPGLISSGVVITQDLSKFNKIAKELKTAGVVNVESKYQSLKNQIYFKAFNNNSVQHLLEGLRGLENIKDDKGNPYITKQQLETEVKNITNAFDKYTQVNEHIDNIASDKYLWRSKDQKKSLLLLKVDLFDSTVQMSLQQELVNKLISDKVLIQGKSLDLSIAGQVADLNDQIAKSQNLLIKLNDNSTQQERDLNYLGFGVRAKHLVNDIQRLIKERDELQKTAKESGIATKDNDLTLSVEHSNKNYEIVKEKAFLVEKIETYQNLLKVRDQKGVEKYLIDRNKKAEDKLAVIEAENKAKKESLAQLKSKLTEDKVIDANSELDPEMVHSIARRLGLTTPESDKLKYLEPVSLDVLSAQLLNVVTQSHKNDNPQLKEEALKIINEIVSKGKSFDEINLNLDPTQLHNWIDKNNIQLSPELAAEHKAFIEERDRKAAEIEAQRIANEVKALVEHKQKAIDKVNSIINSKLPFIYDGKTFTSIKITNTDAPNVVAVEMIDEKGGNLSTNLLTKDKDGKYWYESKLGVSNTTTNPVIENSTPEDISDNLNSADNIENQLDKNFQDKVVSTNISLGQTIELEREVLPGINGYYLAIKRDSHGFPIADTPTGEGKVDYNGLMEFLSHPSDTVTIKPAPYTYTPEDLKRLKESNDQNNDLDLANLKSDSVIPLGIYSGDRLLGYVALPQKIGVNPNTQNQQIQARERLIKIRAVLGEAIRKNGSIEVKSDNINSNGGNLSYRLVGKTIDPTELPNLNIWNILRSADNTDQYGLGYWDAGFKIFSGDYRTQINTDVNISNNYSERFNYVDKEGRQKNSTGKIFVFLKDLSGIYQPVELFSPFVTKDESDTLANNLVNSILTGKSSWDIKTELNKTIFSFAPSKETQTHRYNNVIEVDEFKDSNIVEITPTINGVKQEKIKIFRGLTEENNSSAIKGVKDKLAGFFQQYKHNFDVNSLDVPSFSNPFLNINTSTTYLKYLQDNNKLLANIIPNKVVNPTNLTGEYANQFFNEGQVAVNFSSIIKEENKPAENTTTQPATSMESFLDHINDQLNNNPEDFTDFNYYDTKEVTTPWTDKKEKDYQQEVDTFFKTNLPGLNQIILKDVERFVVNSGVSVFGAFHNMISIVGEDAPLGTRYHEAFHGVFQFLLNDNQRVNILKEAKTKYGKELTDKELEEKLADEFMEFKNQVNPDIKQSFIKQFFNRLLEWIKSLLYPNQINLLFNKINRGEFAQRSLKYKLSKDELTKEQYKILNDYYKNIDTKLLEGWSHRMQSDTIPQMTMTFIELLKSEVSLEKLRSNDGNININPQKYFDEIANKFAIAKNVYDNPKTAPGAIRDADIKVVYVDGKKRLLPDVQTAIKKQLAIYGIIFNEDKISYITDLDKILDKVEDETLKKLIAIGDGETKDYSNTFFQINPIKSASFRMKLFLSGIGKYDVNGQLIKDPFGNVVYTDFVKMYNKTRLVVQNLWRYDEQLQALQESAKTDPQKDFLSAMTNYLTVFSTMEVNTLNNDFRYKPYVNNQTGVWFSLSKEIMEAQQDPSFGFRTYDEKSKQLIPNTAKSDELLKVLLGKDSPFIPQKDKVEQKKQLKSFLSKIAINLADDTLNQVIIDLEAGQSQFKDWVKDIIEHLGSNKDNRKYNIAVQGIARLDASYRSGLYTDSFKNLNGDSVNASNMFNKIAERWTDITGKNRALRIAELQRDDIYKFSNILNYFKIAGNKEIGEAALQVINGIKRKGAKDGKDFTDASVMENLLQSMYYFKGFNTKEGLFKNTVPADKKLQYLFNLPKFKVNLDTEGLLIPDKNEDILKLYQNIVLGEAVRISKTAKQIEEGTLGVSELNSDFKGRKKYAQFYYLPELNDDSLINSIKQIKVDEKFEENVLPLIKDKIIDILNNRLKESYAFSKEEGLDKLVSKEDSLNMNQFIADYKLNQDARYSDLNTLLSGDPAYTPDFGKRSYSNQSMTLKHNFNSPVLRILPLSTGNIRTEELLKQIDSTESGKTEFEVERDKLNTELLESQLADDNLSYDLDPIIKRTKDEERKRVTKLWLDKTAVTDSQVWYNPHFYKEILLSQGKFDDKANTIHEALMKGEIPEGYDITGFLTIYKPFMSGQTWSDERSAYISHIIKSAGLPLYPALAKYSKFYDNLYKALTKQDEYGNYLVDMGVSKDAFKAEIPSLHNIDNFFNTDEFSNDLIINIDSDNFGEQTENKFKGLDGDNYGTRQINLTFAPNLPDHLQTQAAIITDMQTQHITEANTFYKNIKDNNLIAYNQSAINNTIRRGVSEATEDLLTLDSSGRFTVPFNFVPKESELTYMVASSWSNNVIDTPVAGDKFIQIPGIGFKTKTPKDYSVADLRTRLKEQGKNEYQIDKLIDELTKIKNSLKFIRLEDGTVQLCEAYATASSKVFYKKDKNGNLVLKDIKDLSEEERKKLEIIGNRIPYEGYHSMLPIKIIGFLPQEFGNIIVLPSEVTTQMGSDYDLDSVYYRTFSTYKDTNGKLNLYKYLEGKNTLDERYKQYIHWLINENPEGREIYQKFKIDFLNKSIRDEEYTIRQSEDIDEESIKLLDSIFKSDDIDLPEDRLQELKDIKESQLKKLNRALKSAGLLPDKNKFDENGIRNNKMAIQNHWLQTMMDVLKDKSMYWHMMNPSGWADLTKSHDRLMKVKPVESNPYFTIEGQFKQEEAAHNSIILKGMSAIATTTHGANILMKVTSQQPLKFTYDNKQYSVDSYHNRYNPFGGFIADFKGSLTSLTFDELKKPIMKDLNISTQTIGVIQVLAKGLQTADIINYINQPYILKYTEQLANDNSLIKPEDYQRADIEVSLNSLKASIDEVYNRLNIEYFNHPEAIELEKNSFEALKSSGVLNLSLKALEKGIQYLKPENLQKLTNQEDKLNYNIKDEFWFYLNQFKALNNFKYYQREAKELTLINNGLSIIGNKAPGNYHEAVIQRETTLQMIEMLENSTITSVDGSGRVVVYKSILRGIPSLNKPLYAQLDALNQYIEEIEENSTYNSDLYKNLTERIESGIISTNKALIGKGQWKNIKALRTSISTFLNLYLLTHRTNFFKDIQSGDDQFNMLFSNNSLRNQLIGLRTDPNIYNDGFFGMLSPRIPYESITDTLEGGKRDYAEGLNVIQTRFAGLDIASQNDIADAFSFWLNEDNINRPKYGYDQAKWTTLFNKANKIAQDLVKYSLLSKGWGFSSTSVHNVLPSSFLKSSSILDEIKALADNLNKDKPLMNNEEREWFVEAFNRNADNERFLPRTKGEDFYFQNGVYITKSDKSGYILGTDDKTGDKIFANIVVSRINGKNVLLLKFDEIQENGKVTGAKYIPTTKLGIKGVYKEMHRDKEDSVVLLPTQGTTQINDADSFEHNTDSSDNEGFEDMIDNGEQGFEDLANSDMSEIEGGLQSIIPTQLDLFNTMNTISDKEAQDKINGCK